MVGGQRVPIEVALGFLREQIEQHRGAAPSGLRGALTFGVNGSDGLTSWWSIYITREDVRLEKGAVPIEWDGKLVTLYTNEKEIDAITHGRIAKHVEVEGDTDLLETLSSCFEGPMSVYGVREKQ